MSAGIFASVSSITSAGTLAMRFALRARQSKLLI